MTPNYSQGLFTLGVPPEDFDLPHRPVNLSIILIVRNVLIRAFEILRSRPTPLGKLKEDEITAALRGIIENDLRQKGSVNGFDKKMFETVTRQQQVENFDLSKLTKAPDMCFKLRSGDEDRTLSTHDALFVECKPIDAKHSASSDYCDLGLQRFIDGDYAWAMQDALMIGYTRGKRAVSTHLKPALASSPRKQRLNVLDGPNPIALGAAAALVEVLNVSRHSRGFQWVYGKGAATEIRIYHSWHSCD